MNSKKIIPLLIFMLLIVPVSFAANGDYKIPEAVKYVEIEDDGSCIITEEILYDIDGEVNGTYRDIPLRGDQSVTNISVETPGYYNTLEVLEYSDKTRIKAWLYKDKEKTQKVNDEKVKVIYKYTFNKGVKVYNDIAECQYMSWGNEWNSKVNSLKTYIKIPGSSSECEYWNNPDTYVTSSGWNGDVLETTSKNIPMHTNFEQRIIMPKSYIKSTENAQVINIDAKEKIKQDQEKYAKKQQNVKFYSMVFIAIIAIVMLLPAGIYLIFGREPKIDYNAEYEYDLPTDSTPVEVNDLFVDDVGKVDFKAFNAVLLDLIDRGYLKIVSVNSDNTIINVAHKRIDGLKDYEFDLIKYLGKFIDSNGYISMADISEKETRGGYYNFMSNWEKKASNSVPDSLEKRYFNRKGLKVFKIVSILMIIMGILIFVLGIVTILIALCGMFIILEAIVLLSIRNTVFGRWTKEGKEYHDKWMNFKKYLCDYSLIKERPPASVQVWGKYLVYAAALGCANEATETMREYFEVGGVPDNYIADNDLILLTYYGGFHQMDSSFATFQTSDSDGGYGGIGDVGGGGFGGGGGGTF